MPLESKKRRQSKSVQNIGQINALDSLKSKDASLRSKQRRKKAWENVSDWIESSRDSQKNPHGGVLTHEEHKIVILLLKNVVSYV